MTDKNKSRGFFAEFRAFIEKGSAIDMAVGIIVGSVMTGVVNSLVKDVIMPPIGLLIGGVDFSNWFIVLNDIGGLLGGHTHYPTIAAAQAAGVTTLNIGLFLNSLVSFFITMFAVFLFVRIANRIRGEKPAPVPTTRECPYCKTQIAIAATKCPNCCSSVRPVVTPAVTPKIPKNTKLENIKLVSKIKKIIK